MPIYAYSCKVCGRVAEQLRPMDQRDSIRLCGADRHGGHCKGVLERRIDLERHRPAGELPDWTSLSAGVAPSQVNEANRLYADLDVKFDKKGLAHVPGRNRNAFLKRKGLIELH